MRTRVEERRGYCSVREVERAWFAESAGASRQWRSFCRGILFSGVVLAQVFYVFASDAGNCFVSRYNFCAAFSHCVAWFPSELFFSQPGTGCRGLEVDFCFRMPHCWMHFILFFQLSSSASCVETLQILLFGG
jgi:hypothetical protein